MISVFTISVFVILIIIINIFILAFLVPSVNFLLQKIFRHEMFMSTLELFVIAVAICFVTFGSIILLTGFL
jgi:hypothetical protein